MRILYVTPGLGICGGVRVMWQHCVELAKRGHDVVYGVPAARFADGTDKIWLPGNVPIRDYRLVEDEPWDAVVATGYQTWPLAQSSFPKALTKWGFVQMKESLFLGEPSPNAADMAFSLQGFRVITISRWLKEYLEQECVQKDVEIVKNGVDTGLFYPDPDKSLRRTKKPVALIVGHQLNKAKNISDAAKAIRKAHLGCKIWHVCDHDPHPNEKIGANRIFVAPPQDKLRKIYSSVDLLVMSSRAEGRSCIPVEAMACKCPVVAMDHKGMEDLEEGRALIADAGNVDHLAFCIKFALKKKRETKKRVGAAYNYVLAELRWDAVGKRLEELYQASIEGAMVAMAKILIGFECVDKYTGRRYKPGEIIAATEERAEELVEAGHKEIL